MKAWSEFVPLVAVKVQKCPRFTIEDIAKQMAIRFYEESRAWRVRDVTIVAATVLGQPLYTVANPEKTELVGLPAVWIDGIEVKELRGADLDDSEPGKQASTVGVMVVGPTQVRVSPAPDAAGRVIKATVAYKPAADATGLDDLLFAKHSDVIVSKTIAELLLMPDKPWSNAQAAAYYDGKANTDGLSASAHEGPLRRTPLRVKPSSY